MSDNILILSNNNNIDNNEFSIVPVRVIPNIIENDYQQTFCLYIEDVCKQNSLDNSEFDYCFDIEEIKNKLDELDYILYYDIDDKPITCYAFNNEENIIILGVVI